MEKQKYKSTATTAKDILDLNLTELPTLLKGIFPIQGVVALAGSSDLGKSYLLQQLSTAVAGNAAEFLGFTLRIEKPFAIYVSTEDDQFSMCIRLNQLSKHTSEEGLPRLRFIFESTDLVETINAELTSQPASLVVLDTFSDIYPGNLNDAITVRRFLMDFKELANKHSCLIIFNHHCGKRNDSRPPSKENLLGSQGFESSMRTVIELRQDFEDTSLRHFCIVKGNNIPTELKSKSFELNFSFEDGFSATGERVDFNQLVAGDKSNPALQKRVIAAAKDGKSIRQITTDLNRDGIEVGKTKIGKILKDNTAKMEADPGSEST